MEETKEITETKDERLDFVLCTNAESDVTIATISSVLGLFGRGHKFIWDIRSAGGYARTRNVLATNFLKNNRSDVMICLDRDMVFNPESIDHLLEDWRRGCDLVAGLYAVRDGTHLTSFGIGNGNITIDGNLQEVKWLSTGFGLITRNILQKMLDEYKWDLMNPGSGLESYPFFEDHYYKDEDSCLWASEDYDFCIKARKVGVKAFADTRIWVGHYGSKMYEVPDVLEHQKKLIAEAEAKKNIEANLEEGKRLEREEALEQRAKLSEGDAE